MQLSTEKQGDFVFPASCVDTEGLSAEDAKLAVQGIKFRNIFGDPAPGERKVLQIEYALRGAQPVASVSFVGIGVDAVVGVRVAANPIAYQATDELVGAGGNGNGGGGGGGLAAASRRIGPSSSTCANDPARPRPRPCSIPSPRERAASCTAH